MSDEEDKKSSIDEEKEQVLPPIALKKKTTVDHSHGKSIKDFHITRKLGGGAEGAVFLATRLEDKEKIAMKCIIRHSEKDIKRTREELGFLMTLRHENIVDHMMFFEDVKKSFTGEETRFYLVMEYSEDGSLEDYIIAQKKLNQTISVETILKWTTQICECMRYMHKDGLIHRDIKSENLLLSNNHQTMKVCDFGFTKKTEKVLSGTVLGTIVYMAPEIFANTRYDESIDIWSLGVVLLQLILMKNQKEVPDVRIEVGGNPDYIYEFLSYYDTRVTSIVEACLRIDPIDRPTAAEILKHIKNLEDNSGSNATIRRIFTSYRKKKKNVVRPDEVIDDSDMMSLSDALSATMTDTSSQTNSPRGSDSIFRKNSSDDSTLAADGPLCQMSTQKARKFWIDNGWVNKYKVEWLEFREAYRKLMGWNLIPKESERGLKSILIGGDSDFDSEMVSCTAFDRAVLRTGFPFSDQFMHSVWEKSRAEDSELTDRELTQLYASDLSQEEYQHHREEYLRTLIDYDKIFIDPISQEPLSVDSHCAPLRLVTDEEWGELMANEYDMDLEDDKMTRIERLSAWRGHSRSQQQENAINYLTNTERKEHRFIVLGAAAAGKTCMMKLLMYKAAIKSRSEGYLVPLFVPIANLAYNNTHAITDDICGFYLECIRASADSMMNNSLRYDTRIEHFLMHALRHEEALILLDGLDEAANPDVKRRIELAIAEIARVHRNGIIITSRVSGFDSDEDGRNLFHDFTLARIQPLTFPIQLQIALKRGVIDDNFHNSLKGKYRELAQTPLLLSLLIQQFKEKGKLPDLRSELYGEAISTMITVFFRKNEPDKKLADMEREREEILHLLSALACKLHAERRRDFVQADVINNTVTSTTMMNLAMGNRPLSRNSSVQGNIGYGGGGGGAGSAGGGGGGELDGFNTNEEDSDLRAYDEEGRLISREKLVHTWDRLKNWVDQGKFSPLIVLNGKYRFSHLSLQEYLVAHSWAGSKHLSDIRCYENVFFRGRILTFNDKRLRDLVIDPWYRETFLLCAGAMEQSDFIKFATFLQRLYRKQGGLIDSTVYNMINERPPEERDFYKDLERGLNSERKLKVILDGVVHESMDMREMALSRIKLYKNYDKISKELVKRLGDKESYAAQAISLIIPKGNSSTVRRLLDKCCVDKDSKIRAQACFCLGNIAERDDRDVISMLVSLCNDPDQKVVERSIEALSKVAESTGNEQAVNKLIEKLEVMGTRSIAATALGCVAVSNDARVMDILISNAKQFEAAAVALGQVAKRGDQKILNLLIDCLEENGHDEHNITHAISQVADKNHSRQVTDKLIGMLRHKRHTAYRAATALGSVVRTGDKRVINQLIDMMKERACVDKAIVALGYVSDRENALVTDKLLEALGERGASHIVREQAALSLSKVCKKGDHRVIKKLCERLGDVEEVVNAAAAALEKISQKDNVEVIKAFLDLMLHPDTGVVERSVQILGRICTRGQNNEAKHALLKMLQSGTSQSQTLRGMCADALAQVAEFDDENVIQVLVNIVKQSGEDRPSPHLRCCCLTALGILISNRRSPVAFELFEMLHGREQDKEVERECIALLAKICDVGRFVEFLKMRNYRDDRATIFSIVVMAIRFLRGQNPNWKLDQSQIDVLERNKCLESTFILLENAG